MKIIHKPIIKFDSGSGFVIGNKVHSGVKQPMKRSSTIAEPATFKSAKIGIGNKHYSLQTITSSGTPITSFDGKLYSIQNSSGTGTVVASSKNKIIRAADNGAFSSSTPIKIGDKKFAFPILQSNGGGGTIQSATTVSGQSVQIRRPTIYIKRETPTKTIRSITIELIEKNPYIHLGITSDRLGLIKQIICTTANIPVIHLYMTLKKLRQNEGFALLAEYFEMNEGEVQKIFTRTVVKLAKYLKFLIRWPESKKYYDRHKNLPIAFRSKLSYVQSLIECVETDILNNTIYQDGWEQSVECANYKFVLTITPTGVISYVSDAYVGHNDDLAIFNACDFQSVIPKYLSLVADPGKAIRRKRKPFNKETTTTKPNTIKSSINDSSDNGLSTSENNQNKSSVAIGATQNRNDNDSTTDSADESDSDIENDTETIVEKSPTTTTIDGGQFNKLAVAKAAELTSSHHTLDVVNSELISRKVKNFSIPTVRVRESVCRLQIRHSIYCLREFKVLHQYAMLEPVIYQYINEILVIAAALTNLQR